MRSDAADSELRSLRAEAAAAQTHAAQVRADEEVAMRRAREEFREAREKLAAAEATVGVHEERAKRLGADVEAERADGDARVQRLRAEVRRLEQDAGLGFGTLLRRWPPCKMGPAFLDVNLKPGPGRGRCHVQGTGRASEARRSCGGD